jgi:hypothetical protein
MSIIGPFVASFQHEHKITTCISYVTVMYCERLAIADILFRQCAVIEFIVRGKLSRSHI